MSATPDNTLADPELIADLRRPLAEREAEQTATADILEVINSSSVLILLSQRVNAALKGSVVTEQIGAFALKGLAQPLHSRGGDVAVVAYNVPLGGSQAAFRVIEGGAPSA